MIKLVSAMKHTKDKMDAPLSTTEINKYLDAYKSLGADTVDVSTVIGHPNFQSYTNVWMTACHAKGLSVTLRSAHIDMEGLYGHAKAVGTQRKPQQSYITEAVNALVPLPWKTGDSIAIYPERTEGIFQDSTSWISPNDPSSYATFFVNLNIAVKNALATKNPPPTGIGFGFSANNASELLPGSQWMQQTLVDVSGYAVVDHYVDGDHVKYEKDIRAIFSKYGKVYVQEGATNRFTLPTRAQADAYYAVNKKLADEGILAGYGAWGGWYGNPESIIDGSFALNDAGKSLQAWWSAVPTPPVPPTPTPTPTPTTDLTPVLTAIAALDRQLVEIKALVSKPKVVDITATIK